MKKWFVYALVLVLSLSLILTGCGEAKDSAKDAQKKEKKDEKVVIKYTHGLGEDDPHHLTALKFKELVEKYSNGKVEVKIYPADQLGSEQRGFQDVQNGVVQATSLAVNNATPFAPVLGFFDLPYIFKDRNEFYKVIDTLWDDINAKMIEQSGNRAIIWFEQGFRVLTNSKKPVKNINDLQGLKIRVPKNPLMLGAFKAWGSDATPIAWGETFNALQQGVVDGQENPYPVINSMKFYEVQKYITDIHYKMWIGPVVVNEKWLQNQPADIKEAIIKAGKEASVWERELIKQKEGEALENLKKHGMEHLGTPTDEEVWMEKAMAIWPDYYEKIGGTEMLEKVMNVLGRELPKK